MKRHKITPRYALRYNEYLPHLCYFYPSPRSHQSSPIVVLKGISSGHKNNTLWFGKNAANMQFHWEGNSQDEQSNVFSDLEDHSIPVKGRDQGSMRMNRPRSEKYENLPRRGYVKNIADSIDIAHSSRRVVKQNSIKDAVLGARKRSQMGVQDGRKSSHSRDREANHARMTSLLESESKMGQEIDGRNKKTVVAPTSSRSPRWFPIINFASLNSTPSDEKELRGQKSDTSNTDAYPNRNASVRNTNPFLSSTSSSSSPSQKIASQSTNPFASSRSSSIERENKKSIANPLNSGAYPFVNNDNIEIRGDGDAVETKMLNSRSASPTVSPPRVDRVNSKNPFNSRSKSSSTSPPNKVISYPRFDPKNVKNPFNSRSTSSSISPSEQRDNVRYRPRSRSRSRSPVILRPQRPNKLEQSKFHDLLSCATSPDDPKFLSALEILVTSRNPRKLAEMKISQAQNWTALHIASLSNPPLYLVYALLLVYPEGSRELDSAGRLPLHLAAGSETDVTILNTLVRFHRNSVYAKDERGLTPLHLALLRDRSDEITVDVIRVLLGQTISCSSSKIPVKMGGNRKVRDGYMRKKEHLNLDLDKIQDGALGSNRNTEQRKRREKMSNRLKWSESEDHVSRGFARSNESVNSEEMHDHLQALWLEGCSSPVGDYYESIEVSQANNFIPEVQHCLKQLANWKKKYDRENDSAHLEELPMQFVNPASIPAPPYNRLPLHLAVRRNHTKGGKLESAKQEKLALPPNQNEILRILIHAYPPSLTICDVQDETPLMACLQLVHCPAIQTVDAEMIDLLLGVRTPGFAAAPQWLDDIEFSQKHNDSISMNLGYGIHQSTNSMANNAAMIPCNESLPLHIAARESLSPQIIQSICSCYPGAKYSQDNRNRTPLHCALQNEIGGPNVDLEMICILMDDKVLRIKNNLNQSIFDLIVTNAKRGKIPANTQGMLFGGHKTSLFRNVFHHAILEDIANSPSMTMKADNFFCDLQSLPSWLRKEACSTPSVQHILLQELAKPMNTMLILLYGIALVTLTVFFGSMMDSMVSSQSRGNVETMYRHQVIILVTNVYLSLHGLCYNSMAFHLTVGMKVHILDIWSWVMFFALLLSFVVTVWINRQDATMGEIALNDSLLSMGTVTLGLLWISIIGYFSRWWYGIGSFTSSVAKMTRLLVSPLIVISLVTLSFMQMVYITHTRNDKSGQCFYDEGYDSGESLQICSLWDSFQIVYLLIIGEGFIGAESSSGGAIIALLLGFVIIVFIVILHAILSILNLQKTGIGRGLVDNFWSPLLTFVLLTQCLRNMFCCMEPKSKPSDHVAFGENDGYISPRQTQSYNCVSFQQRLAKVWDYLTIFAYSSDELKDTKWWYLQGGLNPSHILSKKWFIRILGVFIIPLWLLFGIVTLGILLPPQVRLWLFYLGIDGNVDEIVGNPGEGELGKDDMKLSDIANVKHMLYERFQSVQYELHDIRVLLEQQNVKKD